MMFGELQKYVSSSDWDEREVREAVVAVAQRLAAADCSFLRTKASGDLDDKSIVDIGHEALIRRWSKLKGGGETDWIRDETDWIREEQDDGEKYRDLVRVARAKGVIAGPELPSYEKWWAQRKPTAVWAKRYTKGGRDYIAEVGEALARSRKEFEDDEREREAAARAEREAREAQLKLAAANAQAEAASARAAAAEQQAKASAAEVAIHRQRSRMRMAGAAAAVIAAAALFALVVTIVYYRYNRQTLINSAIHDLLKLSSDRNSTVDRLAAEEKKFFQAVQFYQIFGGAEINLIDTRLPNLTLHNRSFDNLRLIGSRITGLDLSYNKEDVIYLSPYVFNDSHIANSNLSGANLAYSQFRDTFLVETNFKDSNLYRASFDGAQLCSVDFAGASLLLASFWNSTIDQNTEHSLRHVAWWLAKGWTSAQINDLAGREADNEPDSKMPGFQSARERTLAAFLADPSKTRGIPPDILDSYKSLVSATGTQLDFVRAQALNRWAWTLTINGLHLAPDDWRKKEADGADCARAEPIPTTAFSAAKQALCVVNGLSGDNPDVENYRAFRSSIEDTLGYILLQKREADAAMPHLIKGAGERTRDNRDALFRLAVAEYAMGNKGWVEDMQRSIDYGYVPTHERALLFPEIEKKFDEKTESDFRTYLDIALQTTNRPRNASPDDCAKP